MDNELDGQNSGDVKIGSKKRGGRGVMIVVGGIAAIGAVAAFYMSSNSSEAPKLKALEDFRWAYAKKCDMEEFRGEATPYLRDMYLRSSRLQEEVAKQTTQLSEGIACADIDKGLRTASFPMGAKR